MIEILRSKISEMCKNKSTLERCNTNSVVVIVDELSRMLDLNISSFVCSQVKDFSIGKQFRLLIKSKFNNLSDVFIFS